MKTDEVSREQINFREREFNSLKGVEIYMEWKKEYRPLIYILGVCSSTWFESSWTLAKQIMPLLLMGVLVAGFFLGRPGHDGIIPSGWVASAVGGNSLGANLFASVAGALMYFATLTEVPILQGLIGAGMGKGPALAVDGEVKVVGKIPELEKIKEMIG